MILSRKHQRDRIHELEAQVVLLKHSLRKMAEAVALAHQENIQLHQQLADAREAETEDEITILNLLEERDQALMELGEIQEALGRGNEHYRRR